MRSIKVIYKSGLVCRTNINGTDEEILDYYVNKWFNVGDGEKDKMDLCIAVEFLN